MLLDKQEHKKIMLNILADVSANPILSINTGFKGGTCCYFLYGLDRFSVDLDFDLLSASSTDRDIDKKNEVLREIDEILKKYGTIKMVGNVFSRKVKYNEKSSAIKIDISDRVRENSLNKYEIKDIVSGIPLKTLCKEDIFAHKLIALKERYDQKQNKKIANRDLYDINFFFDNDWKFNDKIIKLRSGKESLEYLQELKTFIKKKVDEKKVLDGLGALVDNEKRLWVKNNLRNEVIKKLAIQIETMK